MINKNIKFLKRYIALLIIGFIAVILTVESSKPIFPTDELLAGGGREVQRAVYAFFMILDGNRIMFYIFIFIFAISPLIISSDYYISAENKFEHSVIQRIGIRKFILFRATNSFFYSALFMLIILMFSLLYLHISFAPIDFSGIISTYVLFSTSGISNLIIFILLSSIGYGILQTFLSALIRFIKNKYVFYSMGLLLTFGTLLLYIFIINIVGKFFEYNILLQYFMSLFVPMNLVTPGLMFAELGLLAFITSATFYAIMIILLTILESKSRKVNG